MIECYRVSPNDATCTSVRLATVPRGHGTGGSACCCGEIGARRMPSVDVVKLSGKRERGGRYLPRGASAGRPGELLSVRVAVGVRYSNGEIVCPSVVGVPVIAPEDDSTRSHGRHRPCRSDSVGVGRRYRVIDVSENEYCRPNPHRRKRRDPGIATRVRAQCPGRVMRPARRRGSPTTPAEHTSSSRVHNPSPPSPNSSRNVARGI